MAFERIGLGGFLKFDERQAVQAMGQGRAAMGRFVKAADRGPPAFGRFGASLALAGKRVRAGTAAISTGAAKIGGAMRSATLALAGFTVGAGLGIKKAAEFEKAMSGVAAVTRATPENFELLTDAAKKAGIETVFSATASAEAMENLARAGFTTQEIIGGLEGVMAAAAAEDINLATASDIVASTIRSFGKDASEAAKVADILALASAKTNTTIVGLGEGLKLVSPVARGLGVSLTDTVATLGLLADTGLKGTLAGTALKNAMLKLAAPTGAGAAALKKLGLNISNAKGDFVGMTSILNQLSTGLNKMGGSVKRTAVAAKLFGLRGVALTNLMSRLDKTAKKGVLTFEQFTKALRESDGVAKVMAETRLRNLDGAITLITASLEAASIALFGEMLKPLATTVNRVTKALNSVLFAFNAITKAQKNGIDRQSALLSITEEFGSTATQVALGVQDAVAFMQRAWQRVTGVIRTVADMIQQRFGGEGIRSIVAMAIKFSLVAAALAPVLAAALAFGFVLGSIIIPAVSGVGSVLFGVGTIIAAVFSGPGIALITGFSLAFDFLRNKIEAIWLGIQDAFMPVVQQLGTVFGEIFNKIKVILQDTFGLFVAGTQETSTNWREVASTVLNVMGTIAVTVLEVVSIIISIFAFILPPIIAIGKAIGEFIISPFKLIFDHVKRVSAALGTMFGGEVLAGLGRLGLALVDLVLSPIQLIARMILQLANAIPGLLVPKALQTFADAGVTGLVFPEEKPTVTIKGPAGGTAETVSKEILELNASQKKRATETPKVEVTANVQNNQTLEIKNQLCVDGQEMAVASAKHKMSVLERQGAKTRPWNARQFVEQGAVAT